MTAITKKNDSSMEGIYGLFFCIVGRATKQKNDNGEPVRVYPSADEVIHFINTGKRPAKWHWRTEEEDYNESIKETQEMHQATFL